MFQIYRYIPGFDLIFARPLTRNDMAFKSDVHIANINVPIAILHAVDDPVVPYFLGVKVNIHSHLIRICTVDFYSCLLKLFLHSSTRSEKRLDL